MGSKRAAIFVFLALCCACTATSTSSLVVQRPPGSPSQSPIRHVFERTCGSDVYGDLGPNWRAEATVVGPLALLGLPGYADATAGTFGARGDRYRALKVLAVVAPGNDVTVTVPGSLRTKLGLLYDPAAFRSVGRYRVSDGEPAVVFRPCDLQRGTQFNGGLIAAGPGCYSLKIDVGDDSSRVLRFPLGRRC
jgi:hypothetical protein